MDKIVELLERNRIGFDNEWNCYTAATIYTDRNGTKIHLTLEGFKLFLRSVRKENVALEFFVDECDYDTKLGYFVHNLSKFIIDKGYISTIYITKKFNFWEFKEVINKVQRERVFV